MWFDKIVQLGNLRCCGEIIRSVLNLVFLRSSSAIAHNQQPPPTKKGSIMGGLTATPPPCSATAHSANISGKEIDVSVLSVGCPQSPLAAQPHQATMDPNVFIPNSREGLSCPQLPRLHSQEQMCLCPH